MEAAPYTLRRTPLARALRHLGGRPWFAAIGRRLAPVDTWLYRRTNGRLGLTGPGGAAYPSMLLTTIGRRSGQRRTTPVMFLADGERLIVTCENFGQQRPAAWPFNLAADPRAEVQIGKSKGFYLARPASHGEAERYWPRFVEIWPAHESYLGRTGVRKMFILEPAVRRRH
jgi:deazaflavin-dependent oxidoreductase (nitroreductase family)